MRISDILNQYNEGVAFEFFPPRSQNGLKSLVATAQKLKIYRPLYVSMTYGAAGSTQGWTKEAVRLLLESKDFVVMPHLTSIGAKESTIQSLLDEYKERGVENIMALRGDPPSEISDFDFSKQPFRYARDLVRFIKQYGHFCIGVAVYPEGHIETASLKEDLEYTKRKIDSGADFAVSQMFFDNTHYYRLLKRMKKKGITIPVLPGILPLLDIDRVKQFVSICRTTIPPHIEEAMSRLKGNPQDMEKQGIEFTVKQCRELIRNDIKRLHLFTLNNFRVVRAILDAL